MLNREETTKVVGVWLGGENGARGGKRKESVGVENGETPVYGSHGGGDGEKTLLGYASLMQLAHVVGLCVSHFLSPSLLFSRSLIQWCAIGDSRVVCLVGL